jgi:hypothetical protein
VAAGEEAAFLLADGYVFENSSVGRLVDDGAGGEVEGGVALLEGFDAGAEFGEEGVVDCGVDDGAGAGGALLAVVAEGGCGDAFDGCVEIAVGVDEDGVFAAHLEDGALDEDLAGLGAGGALVDVEADFLGAGEGDEAGLRVGDEGGAEGAAFAGAEVDDAGGKAGFFQEWRGRWRRWWARRRRV